MRPGIARPVDSDALMLRRTARRVGLQAAALVAVVVIALAVIAGFVVFRQQRAVGDDLLRNAIVTADDVNDPPRGVWLIMVDRGETANRARISPGLPAGLPLRTALDAAARTGATTDTEVTRGGRRYQVRTQARPQDVVQAVLDLEPADRQRSELLGALLPVGAAGLLGAALIGAVLGRRAVRPLSDVLALQRTFVADASHELRTPLTLLSTRAQLLRRDLGACEDQRLLADADGVVGDAQRLAAIVEDLLIAADPREQGEPGFVDLHELCCKVADSARAYAVERRVELIVGPAADEPAVVWAHPAAIRRALIAVVDNAIEHTPAGGSVCLIASRHRGKALLKVTDSGSGLAPQEVQRVFHRFHSGGHHAGRRSYGLGLALARDIAARHNGTLSASSPGEGAGTTFTLEFPARAAASGHPLR